MKLVSKIFNKSTVKFLILSFDNPANILFNFVSSNFVFCYKAVGEKMRNLC